MHTTRLFAILVAGACTAWTPASTSLAAPNVSATLSERIQIQHAEFGLFTIVNGEASFRASKAVPLTVGQAYGWVVKVRGKHDKIKWREEFTLPSAPTAWGEFPAGAQKISADGRTSVVEKEVAPINGVIINSWTVAAGDPPGRYKIRLTMAGADPIAFEFDAK